MDKRKLLGTIIGVLMFAMLIVGATYAWLTLTAEVTNGNYVVGTKHFSINYTGGNDGNEIRATVQTSNATTSNITSATTSGQTTDDGWLAVKASKTAASAPAQEFKINLHINNVTTELDTSTADPDDYKKPLTSKALTYAVCLGDCPTGVALATVSDGIATCGSGVEACGTIDPTLKNTDIVLYTDSVTFNKDGIVLETTYNVYFWLDSETIVSADIGKSFSGYIHASATQGDTPQ